MSNCQIIINMIISKKRYSLQEAAAISYKLIAKGARIKFDDLAAGEDENGEELITCRIYLLTSPFPLDSGEVKEFINLIE